LIKNSQPFGKKFQKTIGGIFFDSHCIFFKLGNVSEVLYGQGLRFFIPATFYVFLTFFILLTFLF